MMSDVTGLRMLQKLGGYAVGAVAGALVTDPSGASMPLQALCAILATSLAVDLGASAAESALQDAPDRLERIETWLAELIRKHGQVAVAVTAIANGIESHSGVDPKQAEWLTTMFAAS